MRPAPLYINIHISFARNFIFCKPFARSWEKSKQNRTQFLKNNTNLNYIIMYDSAIITLSSRLLYMPNMFSFLSVKQLKFLHIFFCAVYVYWWCFHMSHSLNWYSFPQAARASNFRYVTIMCCYCILNKPVLYYLIILLLFKQQKFHKALLK